MNTTQQEETLEILEYEPRFRDYFRQLNLEWIERFFRIEPPDREILEDPETFVLSKGGHIFFARLGTEIVGTCALLKHDDGTFELAKMGVTPRAQGKQVGRRLAEAAIRQARTVGASAVFLETNSRLIPAIRLYESLGFIHEAPPPGQHERYARADVFMRLKI
jgi:putative acetyltransferase